MERYYTPLFYHLFRDEEWYETWCRKKIDHEHAHDALPIHADPRSVSCQACLKELVNYADKAELRLIEMQLPLGCGPRLIACFEGVIK